MAAFSISYLPLALVEALVGGLIIGCFVSYFLLRFFEKIPTKNPIQNMDRRRFFSSKRWKNLLPKMMKYVLKSSRQQ